MQDIMLVVMQALVVIIGIVVGMLANYSKKLIGEQFGKTGLEIAEIIATNAVRAVEQIYKNKNFDGKHKYEQARKIVRDELARHGFELTDEQIKTFIESAVNEMNKNK